MSKKLIAVLVASLSAGTAFAVDEQSGDHSTIATAQRLEVGAGGSVTVFGAIGARLKTEAPRADVDFYSFHGTEGDLVRLNIDGASKPTTSPERSLDSYIALFGPCPTATAPRCVFSDDAPRDAGSFSNLDSRVDNPAYRLPRTGVYAVGVTSFRRPFNTNGVVSTATLTSTSNGSYTLIISGVTPYMLHVNIEVKPGSGDSAPINPKSRGNIPVALLSSREFNAMSVDYSSVTFGAGGNEASLERCSREGQDVDGDGRPDLICHFDAQTAGFEPGDSLAVVRGKTTDGRAFEGVGHIHIVGGNKKSD